MVDRLEILNRLFDGLKFKDAEYKGKNKCLRHELFV